MHVCCIPWRVLMRTRAWRRRWLWIESVGLVEWRLQFFQRIQRKGHRDGGSGRAAAARGLRILFTWPHLRSALIRDVAVGSWPRKKDCRTVRWSWTRSVRSRKKDWFFLLINSLKTFLFSFNFSPDQHLAQLVELLPHPHVLVGRRRRWLPTSDEKRERSVVSGVL